MAYTQNESIDGLTAITPTTDDIVVTMDQAEIGVAKTSTLLSIYNLFKTTYDTIYAKYLGDADFYQYSIVRTVDGSGNLTVALKNYEGNDPTPTKPVKIMIGGVVRTITSALSATMNASTNYFNSGSAELATKEIDYFTYFIWNSAGSSTSLGVGRRPDFRVISDNNASITSENHLEYGNVFLATDTVVNIGRFNAILSAGAGYTWSIPATSVIINNPIYETRILNYTPVLSASGSMTFTSGSVSDIKYYINGNIVMIIADQSGTIGGTISSETHLSLPFTPTLNNNGHSCEIFNGGIYFMGYSSVTKGGKIRFTKTDFSNFSLGSINISTSYSYLLT